MNRARKPSRFDCKLTPAQVERAKRARAAGVDIQDLAPRFGMSAYSLGRELSRAEQSND